MNRTIIFYRTVDGKCPVEDFLDALPGKVAQKVAWVLRLLEDLERMPATYFKKLFVQRASGRVEFSPVPISTDILLL